MGETQIARKTKVCLSCNIRKDVRTHFHISRKKSGTIRYRSQCVKCRSSYSLKWQRANPEKRRKHWAVQRERRRANGHERDSYYRWKYGITLQDYQRISKAQNDLCAICGHPEMSNGVNGKIRVLSVDHNHKSGKVRGLLCFMCNSTLGIVEKVGLEKIVAYLEASK